MIPEPGIFAIETEAGHIRALAHALDATGTASPPVVISLIRSAATDLQDAAEYLAAYQRQQSTRKTPGERTPQ